MAMFGLFKLSEHVKAVLWLWENDKENWRVGAHATVHQPTGIGIWTANSDYGLHLSYDIPDYDRHSCHSCNGRRVDLRRRDRKALYRIVVKGQSAAAVREVKRQVSDWAADKIGNCVPSVGTKPHWSEWDKRDNSA